MSVSSLGGSGYYATFIDDYTRHTSVYFMKTKYKVLEKIKEFYNSAVNFTGKQVKVLRTDNVENTTPKRFMDSERERNYSPVKCSYNPAGNGVAERMNRTIVESVRSMLSHSNMSNVFLAEAVNTTFYLRNRSPTIALKESRLMNVSSRENPMLRILKYLNVSRLFMFLIINERNSKQSHAKQYLLAFLMMLKDTNSMIHFPANSFAVLMSYF